MRLSPALAASALTTVDPVIELEAVASRWSLHFIECSSLLLCVSSDWLSLCSAPGSSGWDTPEALRAIANRDDRRQAETFRWHARESGYWVHHVSTLQWRYPERGHQVDRGIPDQALALSALCGPACRVVWQGRVAIRSPMPIIAECTRQNQFPVADQRRPKDTVGR